MFPSIWLSIKPRVKPQIPMLANTSGSMDSSRKDFTQHAPMDQAQFWALLEDPVCSMSSKSSGGHKPQETGGM